MNRLHTLSPEEIKKEVEKIIIETLESDSPISINDNLNEQGLDSMKSISLIVLLEEKFNIEFDDSELILENFIYLEKIVKSILNKLC